MFSDVAEFQQSCQRHLGTRDSTIEIISTKLVLLQKELIHSVGSSELCLKPFTDMFSVCSSAVVDARLLIQWENNIGDTIGFHIFSLEFVGTWLFFI